MYKRALRIPNVDLADTWKNYLEFAGKLIFFHMLFIYFILLVHFLFVDVFLYFLWILHYLGEDVDEEIRAAYEASTNTMKELSKFELKLAETDDNIEAFYEYLNFEKG